VVQQEEKCQFTFCGGSRAQDLSYSGCLGDQAALRVSTFLPDDTTSHDSSFSNIVNLEICAHAVLGINNSCTIPLPGQSGQEPLHLALITDRSRFGIEIPSWDKHLGNGICTPHHTHKARVCKVMEHAMWCSKTIAQP
jgi:hypothetical protein